MLATGICLLGPLFFFAQDRRHALFARGGKLRYPIAGEHNARLGELALVHTRNGIGDHGLGLVERHIARQRAVAPRAEVIALDSRRPSGGICEVDLHLNIIGIGRPAVAHKLPVKLGGIGPVHDRTGHGIAHVVDRAVTALVGAKVALVGAVDLVKRGVVFFDAQHANAHRAALLV